MHNKKICIVSPDIIGPVKNGGIGTHCYYLAETLVDSGFDVSILFTGPLQNKTHLYWQDYYENLNIQYFHLEDFKKVDFELHSNNSPFLETSYFVCEFLKDKDFDFIHFQEWLANALVTIQAKETTEYFDKTTLTVTMHSSTQWQQEGMMLYSTNPLYDMKLKWAEEYCVANCDVVISPSNYMLEWAKNSNWDLAKTQKVLPNCFKSKINQDVINKVDISHLIFFGRLETRKGLEYFVNSLIQIKSVEKVSFLGKISITSEGSANKYLANKLKNLEFKIYDKFDTFEAVQFIKKEQGLVIIPSLQDNFPYTVIEMIENKVAFVCSNVGGIPEMVDNRVTFDIRNKNGLVDLLSNLRSDLFLDLQHKYDSKSALKKWIDFHSLEFVAKNFLESCPLVSICVPYYNYPKYLPMLLESLEELDYDNFEVIIVNDGSSQKEANSVFEQMKELYPDYSFFTKQNSGVGDTRNYAASKANGKYLIFMDSDNLSYPNMINDFVKAIQKSDVDLVTCYFDAFGENYSGSKPEKFLYKYLPLGACKEAGILENIYGDANFIVKRDIFEKIGGFGVEKDTSWEDWEFLAKLSLEEYTQKIIPKSLFCYRHTEAGFSRNTSIYKNHQRVLRCYSHYYPKEIQNLLSGFVVPSFYGNSNGILNYIKQTVNKFLPINSKRRKIVKKLIKGILK